MFVEEEVGVMEEQVSNEFCNAKELVMQILKEDERARNDDLWLLLQVWQKKQQIKIFVPYNRLKEMMNMETVTRVRRKIQEIDKNGYCAHPELLPTIPRVWFKRKLKEEAVRRYFANRKSYLMEYEALKYGIK